VWYVYVPRYDACVEASSIDMDFRINAVSHARIAFHECLTLRTWSWLRSLFTVGEPVQIKHNKRVYFNGYVHNVSYTKTQHGYDVGVVLYDPLGKLTRMAYKGGFSGRLRDLIEQEICPYIGINNRMKSDVIVNLRYDYELTRFALLVDACTLARYQTDVMHYGFYYNHQLNALCELNDKESHTMLQSLSDTNRISIEQSHSYPISNVVQVTNIRG